jgi:hypothetical protein
MAQVTKSGGPTVMVAFGSPAKIDFLSFFIRAVQAAVPGSIGPPMDPVPLPFQSGTLRSCAGRCSTRD